MKDVFPNITYKYSNRVLNMMTEIVSSRKTNYGKGIYVKQFEKKMSKYLSIKHTFATCSGTMAIQIALRSLNVGRGDEVILPGYTFIAVAQAVLNEGAIPIFADIDDTYNVSFSSIKNLISKKTKAIIIVHMFGNPAKLTKIINLSKKKGIHVIEDCSQAFGAEYKNTPVGNFGDVACFSFNANKVLPTGEGGMVATNDSKIAEKLNLYRNLGSDKSSGKTRIRSIGYKIPMTEMQGALGLDALNNFPRINKKRQANWKYLTNELKKYNLFFLFPEVNKNASHSYYRFVIELNTKLSKYRSEIIKKMRDKGFPLRTFYPKALYQYELFEDLSKYGLKNFHLKPKDFPDYPSIKLKRVEQFCKRQVGIECSPYLKRSDLQKFITSFVKVVKIISKEKKS